MRSNHLRRREFITLLGGAAALPLAGHAQQSAMPVIGYLSTGSAKSDVLRVTAIWQGLNQTGFVDGQNVTIEYRWAEGQNDRLPALATNLVNRQVAVIVTVGTPPTVAAKMATSTIPILFNLGVDPVQAGLVASLHRPGGNLTGVSLLNVATMAKRLDLLHELVPTAVVSAVLVNPPSPLAEAETKEAQQAARSLGLRLHVLNASTESEIDTAFATLVKERAGTILVSSDTFFTNHRVQLV